ncbi:unnamed protein product [Tenebrio molitor]|nr:unnamed protein product [Tenebrio molitor]
MNAPVLIFVFALVVATVCAKYYQPNIFAQPHRCRHLQDPGRFLRSSERREFGTDSLINNHGDVFGVHPHQEVMVWSLKRNKFHPCRFD